MSSLPQEIASLSTEPADSCTFLISVFDVPEEQLPSFYEREEEFSIVPVHFEELDGRPGSEVSAKTRVGFGNDTC